LQTGVGIRTGGPAWRFPSTARGLFDYENVLLAGDRARFVIIDSVTDPGWTAATSTGIDLSKNTETARVVLGT